ncbi:MAG: DUF4124 domain-containing protein [Mariprofundaceae bacterium]
MFRLLLTLSLALYAVSSYAGEIYKWKDDAGIVHFTDNMNTVPAKYRNEKPLIMKDASPVVKSAVKRPLSRSKSKGDVLWINKCAACHHLGKGQVNGLKGLGYLAVNSVTKFPSLIDEILPDLKYATVGRTSDMEAVELSEDELRAVAQYIINSKK